MNLPQSGTDGRDVTTFKRMNRGEKLLATENTGATKSGFSTHLDHLCHAANVVVVPVCGDDEHDHLIRVEIDGPQIIQGRRRIGAPTRVHDDPCAAANVQNNALTIPRTKEGQLKLIVPRGADPSRHFLNACSISRAQLRPSRKSRSAILGRSRKTIWEMRFFVPAGDRS